MSVGSDLFPASPQALPGITEPTPGYRRHAWLALAGLLTFVALYAGMVGYLVWTIVRLVGASLLPGGSLAAAVLLSLPSAFFLALLISGVWGLKSARPTGLVEVSRAEQPELFAFLDRLAEETSAPRPHRVFFSARVNAAVFYDLSLRNLLFPVKKNLELGLGLLNALSLDELKAVVAHEFGHFAQRTMAVGRYVYVAQQVAGQIVAGRTWLDGFLLGLSRTDIRIAWVGWGMRLLVWAMRMLLDAAFRVVLIADRALSREMEFQADRVSVSVAGSDSLVHALHRLGAADEAWEHAAGFVSLEVANGRPAPELFELQSTALADLQRVLDDAELGLTPKRPANAAEHRVFKTTLAQPPRMWMTHPPNSDREVNAKAIYVPSVLDARPGWALIREPAAVRRKVIEATFEKPATPLKDAPPPPQRTPEERFRDRFTRPALDPRYRGAYLQRSIAAHVREASAMVGASPGSSREAVLDALSRLYPVRLRDELKDCRERRDEEAQLEGIAEGFLAATGGVIRHRGRELRRTELPAVLAGVKRGREAAEQKVFQHDKACRAAHLAAAALAGPGWREHLAFLIELLHFSTHTARELADAFGAMNHALEMAFADGRVSDGERRVLLTCAQDLYAAMERTWKAKAGLRISSDVEALFVERRGWTALGESLGLLAPSEPNLGPWVEAMGGWSQAAIGDLRALTDAALDALLTAEAKVADALERGEPLEAPPAGGAVPSGYATRLMGEERKRNRTLDWWDKFHLADGLFAGVLRTSAAGALLLPAFMLAGSIGRTTVHVVNGLERTVQVRIGEQRIEVGPRQVRPVEVEAAREVTVTAQGDDGALLESFVAEIGSGYGDIVYDVVQAAPLFEWTATYGPGNQPPARKLGAPRWFEGHHSAYFRPPPQSVSTRTGGTQYRTVLEAVFGDPSTQLDALPNRESEQALALAHLKFETRGSRVLGEWVSIARGLEGALPILLARAGGEPREVIFERALQDELPPAERVERCEQTRALAAKETQNGELQYLSARCHPRGKARQTAFLEAWKSHPKDPWLNWAVTEPLAAQRRWPEAITAAELALEAPSTAWLGSRGLHELMRMVRAARFQGVKVETPRVLENLSDRAPLELSLRMERPARADEYPIVSAFRMLHQGDLADAVRAAQAVGGGPRMTLLAGASDGAEPGQVSAALAMARATVPADLAWVSVALAARERQPYEFENHDSEEHRAFVQQVSEQGWGRERLELFLNGMPLVERAQLLATATIILGDKAPKPWREEAEALLFVEEKPYFRKAP